MSLLACRPRVRRSQHSNFLLLQYRLLTAKSQHCRGGLFRLVSFESVRLLWLRLPNSTTCFPPNIDITTDGCSFFEVYHPRLPILADSSELMQGSGPCDLLLWTILSVASTSLAQYSTYRQILQPHVQRMASEIYSLHDQPLQSVQALVLLCWWPFSSGATRDDPVWTYSGLAVQLALQHGFHRPEHRKDFIYAAINDEIHKIMLQRAWVGCILVNQLWVLQRPKRAATLTKLRTSSYLGLPATVRPRWQSHLGLPPVLDQHLQIACHQYHICESLGNFPDSSTGLLPSPLTTIEALESHLHSLKETLGTFNDTYVEFYWLYTKLCLYSFVVSAESLHLGPRRPILLSTASDTAVKVIHLASSTSTQDHWSNLVRVAVVFAVNMLLLLSTIPGHDQQVAVRNSIGEAWRMIQSRSEHEHDTWSRMAKIIAYLSRVYVVDKAERRLTVRSRMAANVLFENAWHAKQRFSRNVHDSKPVDYTAAAALEDLTFLDFPGTSFDPTSLDDFFTTDEPFSWYAEL